MRFHEVSQLSGHQCNPEQANGQLSLETRHVSPWNGNDDVQLVMTSDKLE